MMLLFFIFTMNFKVRCNMAYVAFSLSRVVQIQQNPGS